MGIKYLLSNVITGQSVFLELIWRFGLNMIVIIILARWLYYPTTRRRSYLFTYILISTLIFLLCYLLKSVTLQIGFSLGLFAIFGVIRYRTNSISIKEMTYLFLIIGISVINSLADTKEHLKEVLFSNLAIILITFSLEKLWLLKRETEKTVVYDKLDLIRPERYDELVKDLEERTGIKKINKIGVGKIDFTRNVCNLKVFYDIPGNQLNVTDPPENNKDDDDD
jgi:hypothetical protein